MAAADAPSDDTGRASPPTAATWVSELAVRWWIAGGRALDLYAGGRSPTHGDLDVGILRRDAPTVLAALNSWTVCEANDGALTPLRVGEAPRPDVHSLWCRPAGERRWVLELMLDEAAGDQWLFRRDPAIRVPLGMLVRCTADGIRYLAPQVQLLYKARAVRVRDQADLDRVAPRLDDAARTWLREALACLDPKHQWLRPLGAN
jgi:hypothetical protein